jgi:AraC family transcriptional regulator
MHSTLGHDEFFGRRMAVRKIGSYALSLTRYERGTDIPLHSHDHAYLTLVVDGSYRERASGVVRDCVSQSIILHAPGERHADVFGDRAATCLNVHGGSFDRSALLSSAAAAGVAWKLRREFRQPDALSPIVLEALMLELFVETQRDSDDQRAPRWLREVRSIIEERFAEPLTLGGLAEAADVHRAHLARAFRTHYGTTVGDLLRELRVAYAKQRLESRAPLSDIAADAGFADQSHFTRTFRRATGVTPAAFRKALR